VPALHAGVVDEDVDLAEVGLDLGDKGGDAVEVGEVVFVELAALALGGDLVEDVRVALAADDGDVGASFGEADGHGFAKAAAGAGEEGYFAFEAEHVEHGCSWFSLVWLVAAQLVTQLEEHLDGVGLAGEQVGELLRGFFRWATVRILSKSMRPLWRMRMAISKSRGV